jgi:hypothetical protein
LGLASVGEHVVRSAFKKLDKNKNGRLDMSEAMSAYETVKNLYESLQAKPVDEN